MTTDMWRGALTLHWTRCTQTPTNHFALEHWPVVLPWTYVTSYKEVFLEEGEERERKRERETNNIVIT